MHCHPSTRRRSCGGHPVLAGLFSLSLLLGSSARGASPWQVIVLQIDEVPGESRQAEHEGWIDVSEFAQAITLAPEAVVAPQRVLPNRRLPLGRLAFTKQVDKSSPKLAEAVCNGFVFPKARFEFVRISQTSVRFYAVELEQVQVTAHQISGSGGEIRPTETVSIDFDRATWTYTAFSNTGKALADYRTVWDFIQNDGGSTKVRRGFLVRAGTEVGKKGIRLRWLAQAGKKYRIFRSNLVTGQFTRMQTDIPASIDEERELWLPLEAPVGFFILTELDAAPGQP